MKYLLTGLKYWLPLLSVTLASPVLAEDLFDMHFEDAGAGAALPSEPAVNGVTGFVPTSVSASSNTSAMVQGAFEDPVTHATFGQGHVLVLSDNNPEGGVSLILDHPDISSTTTSGQRVTLTWDMMVAHAASTSGNISFLARQAGGTQVIASAQVNMTNGDVQLAQYTNPGQAGTMLLLGRLSRGVSVRCRWVLDFGAQKHSLSITGLGTVKGDMAAGAGISRVDISTGSSQKGVVALDNLKMVAPPQPHTGRAFDVTFDEDVAGFSPLTAAACEYAPNPTPSSLTLDAGGSILVRKNHVDPVTQVAFGQGQCAVVCDTSATTSTALWFDGHDSEAVQGASGRRVLISWDLMLHATSRAGNLVFIARSSEGGAIASGLVNMGSGVVDLIGYEGVNEGDGLDAQLAQPMTAGRPVRCEWILDFDAGIHTLTVSGLGSISAQLAKNSNYDRWLLTTTNVATGEFAVDNVSVRTVLPATRLPGVVFVDLTESKDQATLTNELANVKAQGYTQVVLTTNTTAIPSADPPVDPMLQRAQWILTWADTNGVKVWLLINNCRYGVTASRGDVEQGYIDPVSHVQSAMEPWIVYLQGHASLAGVVLGKSVGPEPMLPASEAAAPTYFKGFRHWLLAQHGSLAGVNAAWGTSIASIQEIGLLPANHPGFADLQSWAAMQAGRFYGRIIDGLFKPGLGYDLGYGAEIKLGPPNPYLFVDADRLTVQAFMDTALAATPPWRQRLLADTDPRPLLNTEAHLYNDHYNYGGSVDRTRYYYLVGAAQGQWASASYHWSQWNSSDIQAIHAHTPATLAQLASWEADLRAFQREARCSQVGVLVTEPMVRATWNGASPASEPTLEQAYAYVGATGQPWQYVLDRDLPTRGQLLSDLVVWNTNNQLPRRALQALVDLPAWVQVHWVGAYPQHPWLISEYGTPLDSILVSRLQERIQLHNNGAVLTEALADPTLPAVYRQTTTVPSVGWPTARYPSVEARRATDTDGNTLVLLVNHGTSEQDLGTGEQLPWWPQGEANRYLYIHDLTTDVPIGPQDPMRIAPLGVRLLCYETATVVRPTEGDTYATLYGAINGGANPSLYRKVIISARDAQGNPRTWYVSKSLKFFYDKREVVFEPNVTIMTTPGSFKTQAEARPFFQITARNHIVLRGNTNVNIVMRKEDYHTAFTNPELGYYPSEGRGGISLLGAKNVTISDLRITRTGGDGIRIAESGVIDSENITLQRVIMDNNYRMGLAIIYGRNVLIEDCQMINITEQEPWKNPCSGMDVEANEPGHPLENIVFRRCRFANNFNHGIFITFRGYGDGGPISITFEDCISEGNGGYAPISSSLRIAPRMAWGTLRFVNCTFIPAPTAGAIEASQRTDGAFVMEFENCTPSDLP